jgi:formylglycine-generating enzyme required for sulfatase activity
MSPRVLLLTGLFITLASCSYGEDQKVLLKQFAAEFVDILPGTAGFPKTFRRGSAAAPAEGPMAEVTISQPFAIGKYEVQQNLYESVMGKNPSRWKGPRNSVEMMTWGEAKEFCDRVTRLMREAALIGATDVIRLPTEAEWEYCCRAGTETAYSFGEEATAEGDQGNRATRLDPYAWHTGNAAGNDPPVGALKPNPWGLYDMHGYLWEFCGDGWAGSYEGAPVDGSPRPVEGAKTAIVIRSGSWKDRHPDLRSSSRREFPQTGRDDAVGFRCVRSQAP